jgi:hypothetical protein
MSISVLLYGCVVTLLASAAALIATAMPFTSFRHVLQITFKVFSF